MFEHHDTSVVDIHGRKICDLSRIKFIISYSDFFSNDIDMAMVCGIVMGHVHKNEVLHVLGPPSNRNVLKI